MIKLYADLAIKDRKNKIIWKKTIECKSFVRQFLEILLCHMGQFYISSKCTNGNLVTVQMSSENFRANAGSGDTSLGILVGTGSTSPTIDDYAMESLISHGTGANQLQYGAVAFGDPTCDANSCHFTITRDFSNASGESITVYEIGLVVVSQQSGSGYNHRSLVVRDVISAGISIPNGETLTINYRIKVVV